MHVAICIVGFRNPVDIADCLKALSRSTHTDFEVVICENGGAAASQVLAEGLPGVMAGGQPVRIITAQRNLGYAGGVNVCLRAAPEAEAWWVLNPDTRPDPAALEELVARLGRGDCAAVGSTIYFADGKVQGRGGQLRPWLARAIGLDYGKALADPPSADLEARLWYLSGASMIVGRGFIDGVGVMREDYFLYGEEVEWCLRARAAGLKLGLAPASNVLHQQGTTTGSVHDMRQRSKTAVYLDERNKMLLIRDHFPWRLPVVAATALILLGLRFGKRRAWRQLGYALSGWAAGLANRRGKPDWLEAAHG
jgi:N-acetylglucosaminyl-diphospho-decaprenol L-rhamnosyltransferase